MAKKLKDEDLILNVIVNGKQGKKELGDLSRFIKDATKEVGGLEKQEAKLVEQGKKNSAEYKAVTAAIRQKNEAIDQARTKMVQLATSMDVSKMSATELKSTAIALKKAMDNSVPGTEPWNKFKTQLEVVDNRIVEVKKESEATGSALNRMATGFNKYLGIVAAGIASFLSAISGARAAIDVYAELDDVMGGVQKTTGLAKDEVKDLNKELMKIDTRTTQEDLLGLGRIGGKLGIGDAKELEGFVRATNQIVVSLNEDLGGNVEETVNQLGKLVGIFKLKDEFGIEQALIKAGSAINELGAASEANEGYLVDFAQRAAGIAPSANISLQNVLGLAATLDALGQSAEVAGTTYANIMPDLFRNTGTYAKVAGVELKEFTELLNTDANEAFIRVLEGVKGNNAGMSEMVKRLDDLGVDGARSVSVLSALSNNTQALRVQQDLANKSFAEGTSIGKEYNTMNSTAQAELEKSQKKLHLFVAELGEQLYPVMTASNTLLALFVNLLSALIRFLSEHGKVLITVVSAVIAYNTAVFVQNALSKEGVILRRAEIALAKLKVFWDNAQTAAMRLLSAGYLLLRGEIALAKAEMVAFNLITKMNPIAILIAVLAAAAIGLTMYTRKLSEAERMQRLFNDVQVDASKAVAADRNQVKTLTDALSDELLTRDEKLIALKKLKDMMPDHLKGYSDEEILAGKATDAIQKYITMLESKARADAAIKKITALDEESEDLGKKTKAGFSSLSLWEQTKYQFTRGKKGAGFHTAEKGFLNEMAARQAAIEEEKKALRDKFKADLTTQATTPVTTPVTTDDAATLSARELKQRELEERKAAAKAKREREEARQKELNAENEAYQERLKAEGLFNRSRSSLTTEELEKLAVLEQDHQQKVNAINEKGHKATIDSTSAALVELDRIQQAQKKYRQSLINPMNEAIEQESEAHRIRIEKAGLTNQTLEDLQAKLLAATQAGNQKEIESLREKINTIEILEGIHRAKLNQIDAKTLKDGIQAKQRAFETGLADLRIKNNVELSEVKTLAEAKRLLEGSMSDRALASIKNLNDAKKQLQKKHQSEENAYTKQHLEELLRQLQDSIASGEFEGLNLSDKILSDEEKKELEKKILEVKNLLASLKDPSKLDDKISQKQLDKADILGFSASDWDQMFQNLADGKISVDSMAMAAHGLVDAWQMYNQFVEAGEKKQLQQFEAGTTKKKEALWKQLDSGRITQEKYNTELEKLDAALDQKRAQFEYNQAKRAKNIALTNALMNTAVGVTAALTSVPPNVPLSIAIGIIGAAQAGVIAATPLPDVPGKEEGGFIDVTRAQDGKRYRAKNDPDKRGFVDQPTVLVGESGSEFVVNHDGVSNPSIRPVLSAIDTAQKNGTISTLNLENIMASRQSSTYKMKGNAGGGYFDDKPNRTMPVAPATDPMIIELLEKNIEIQNKLSQQLEDGITAEVALLGKNGFNEKQKEFESLQKTVKL